MNGTMQAAVAEVFGKPLTIKTLPIPAPGSRQILLKTEVCGVGHNDLRAANGDWPVKLALPFVPGHASGKVRADIELARLTSINDILERLAHDTVASRVVIDFAPVTTGAAQPELVGVVR